MSMGADDVAFLVGLPSIVNLCPLHMVCLSLVSVTAKAAHGANRLVKKLTGMPPPWTLSLGKFSHLSAILSF